MKPIRKEIADLIREAMNQHELARDFYHRMAHRVSHPETRETFHYLAKEAEENKERLHHCLTSEGCPMVPPVHDAHLAEHLQVPEVTEDLSPKDALALAIKRSEGLCGFYQSMVEMQPPGQVREFMEYMARAMGMEPERLEMFNLSSSEGPRFAAICKEMSERAHKLSPNPVKREARAARLAAQKAAGEI